MVVAHQKDVCASLQFANNWEVNLIGNDGSVSVDVLPLILCSPFLKDILLEHEDKPYLTVIVLPDFSIRHLALLIDIIKKGCTTATISQASIEDVYSVADTLGMTLSSLTCLFSSEELSSSEDSVFPSQHNCNLCEKSFGNVELLNWHEKYAHYDDITLRLSSESSELEFRVEAKKTFQCKICKKLFSDEASRALHMKEHSDITVYECKQCGKKFRSKAVYDLHSHKKRQIKIVLKSKDRKSNRKSLHDCHVCGKIFRSKAVFDMHMDNQYCSKQIERKSVRTFKKFFCRICDKQYKQKEFFLQHMLIHSEEQQLRCGECQRTFTKKSDLIRHMRLHTKGYRSKKYLPTPSQKEELEDEFGKSEVTKLFSAVVNVQKLSGTSSNVLKRLPKKKKKMQAVHSAKNKQSKPYKLKSLNHKKVPKPKIKEEEITEQEIFDESQETVEYESQEVEYDYESQEINPESQEIDEESQEMTSDSERHNNNVSELQDHKYTRKQTKDFTCEECNEQFTFHIGLEYHMKRKHFLQVNKTVLPVAVHVQHGKEKPFMCQCCLKRFHTLQQWQTHKKNFHTPLKFQCKVCDKIFYHVFPYRRHMLTHAEN